MTKLACPNDAVVQHAIDIATAEPRLKACVFGPTFAARLCEWAGRLKWRAPLASGDVSWPELYLDFVHATGTRAPVNQADKNKRFNQRYIVSYYALRDNNLHASMMDDSFVSDMYVFRNAVKFLNDNLDVALFSGQLH